MKISKFTIIICIQILLLCIAFYFIGYGKAYQKSVDYANEFIDKNCIKSIGIEESLPEWEQAMFNVNITMEGENG